MNRTGLAWFLLLVGATLARGASHNDPCVNPKNLEGLCVYLRECPELYKLWAKRNVAEEESRYVMQSKCGKDATNKILLCCAGLSEPTNVLPRPYQCGMSLSERAVGGQPTEVDEFPWMALLQYRRRNARIGYYCGGTLINRRYVLTAAHCINQRPDWKLIGVRLGEYDWTNDEPDCYLGDCADLPVDFGIEKIIIHEQYDPTANYYWNDIALIRLDRNVEMTHFIAPICLPLESRLKSLNHVGTRNWAVGWGITEEERQSNVKLKVKLEVINRNQCASIYRDQNVTLTDSQMCAGGKKGEDTCSGDSGGPLMRQIGETYYQFGMVSFGPKKCGTENFPSIYTDIAHFVDWIESKLE